MLIDGRVFFEQSINEFYGKPDSIWAKTHRRNGHLNKANLSSVSDHNPSYLEISHNKMLTICPNCNNAEYVWREGPYVMICAECNNADIGGMARRVEMPSVDDLFAIEALLDLRPKPENRNWMFTETVEDLLNENIDHSILPTLNLDSSRIQA